MRGMVTNSDDSAAPIHRMIDAFNQLPSEAPCHILMSTDHPLYPVFESLRDIFGRPPTLEEVWDEGKRRAIEPAGGWASWCVEQSKKSRREP